MGPRAIRTARRVATAAGAALHRGRLRLRRARARGGDYSSLGEEDVVRRLASVLRLQSGFAVDVAACDGSTKSNTRGLHEDGWRGLAVEGDPRRFADLARAYRHLPHVSLARAWITPDNVVALLRGHGVPQEFEFLNLDIDGYDHFVLAALLAAFRPRLICSEINEKIPPPVKFTVRYDPDYEWAEDHFYGQSITTLHELADSFDYALVELHYNNAFLVPAEHNPLPSLSPSEAYARGYLDRPDRLRLFPWNADMEDLHGLDGAAQVALLEQRFARYRGRFDLGL